jgi:hypothetical protein
VHKKSVHDRGSICRVRADVWRGWLHAVHAVYYFSARRESKAGKFGTFVLFLVLAFGMLGFVAKQVIIWVMEG